MSDVKQPKYLEDARAYELVAQHISRMLANDGFSDESKQTIRKLKSIQKQMEGGIVRSNEKANMEKPQPRKKQVNNGNVVSMDWQAGKKKRSRRG